MSNVFISYSRKDTAFARRLFDALTAQQRSAWADWEGIPYSVDFWREIQQGIDAAEVFVTIISPDSMVSMVCNQEVAHARQNNKRIVPIMHRTVDERAMAGEWFGKDWENIARENWAELKKLNWLFFRDETDDFETAFASLTETIDQDPEQVRFHTRLLVKAREWEAVRSRDHGQLLRGAELQEAEAWLRFGADRPPKPTPLHSAYIEASITQREREADQERARQARLRALAVVLSVLLIFAVIAAGLAINRTQAANESALIAQSNADRAGTNEAVAERQALEARSLALAANAQAVAGDDRELALALAVEANLIPDPPLLAQSILSRYAYTGGQVIARLDPDPQNPRDDVRASAFSPDGALLALGEDDGGLTLWDARTLELRTTLPAFEDEIMRLAFSADGARLAVGYGTAGGLAIVTLADQSVLTLRGHRGTISGLGFTPDGARLITSDMRGEVRAWAAMTGETLWQVDADLREALFSNANGALSPDGATYYVADPTRYRIRVLDTATGAPTRDFSLEVGARSNNPFRGCAYIVVHPDNARLLCAGDAFDAPILLLVDARTGRTLVDYPITDNIIAAPAFSADGARLVTSDITSITLWDTEAGRAIHTYTGSTTGARLAISPDGVRVIDDQADGVNVLDAALRSGAVDADLGISRAFSYDAERGLLWQIVADGQTLRLLDATDGGVMAAFSPLDDPFETMFRLAALPDGGLVTVQSHILNDDAHLVRWAGDELHDDAAPIWEIDLDGRSVYTLTLSADGARGVTSFFGATPPAIWDLEAGALLHTLDAITEGGGVAAITPDGARVGTMSCYARAEGASCTDDRFDVWDAATGALLYSLPGLNGGVAVSSDSRLWALSDVGGVILLVDVASGEVVKRLYGHTGNVGAMAFNAEGTQLISGAFSGAKSILVWDVASGQVLREIDAGSSIWQLAVAASGDRFFSLDQPALTQTDQFIKRWRVDPSVDALLSWTERNREWRTFTCSERARYAIAPLCDEAVEAESAAEAIPTRTPFPAVALQPTRTPLPRTNTPTPTATPTLTATPTPAPYRYQALYAPRWSPDGTRLLAGELSGFVVVWDGATGRELYRLEGHDSFASTNGPRGLWSPDGARIATYSAQNTAQIWDAATGALLHTLRGHNDHIGALRWSPDGSRLATAGDDGTARVWDAATGAPIFVLEGHTAPVFSLAFSPDGDLLATGGEDATARVWDMATGAERWAFGERERILSVLNMNDDPPIITQVVWSADGSRLIAAGTDGAAIVWDVTDGARLFTLRVPGERGLFDTLDYFLGAVFWSPDEAQIILGSLGSAPTVWDVETESLLYALEGHTDLTLVLGWSPDGARLLTAGYDGTLRVWDAATGELALLMDHRATLYSAAWSPDGSRIASVAENGSARLWDAATGDELSFVAQQPAAEATPQITYVLADSRATSAALLQQAAQVMPTFGLELTREARAITATAVQFALAPTQIRDQPDAAGLLFSEDFADNAVDWEIDNGASPDVFARLRDGKYVIDLADQLNWFTVPGSTTPARAPWFTTPFEMTFEVDGIESDQDEVGVFVAFNVQPGMMAWTGIDVHESGYVTLVRNFEVIDEVEGQPFRLHRDRANAVRLRVTPEVYEVYINDARIAAIPADEPISGTIGFGFGSLFAQGDYYAEIDNLTVRPLSGLDDESGPTSTPTPGATPTPTASPT